MGPFSRFMSSPDEGDGCSSAGWDLAAHWAVELQDHQNEVWWLIVLCIVLALGMLFYRARLKHVERMWTHHLALIVERQGISAAAATVAQVIGANDGA